jgi:hypothetical protein
VSAATASTITAVAARSRQTGNRADEAGALASRGDSAPAAGDPDQARDVWDKALIILDELRLPMAISVRRRTARLNERSAKHAACLTAARLQTADIEKRSKL